ncbi:MAG: SBBP repeat-containing protein, partial [Candidatus Brocadiales bacterium]|nr:SBBP repeat-containing protein [Candidatus Brocadiales bacterium]MDO8130694.1 SBBP repeat-containing protein [Candidatus Brocadiales bacterium]
WKTNISTYDSVNLGEIYDGIELKLRAYGNNVEKLFCVKPGADPEQIKIRLSGAKDCGVQKAEITHPLVPSREGINPKSDASTSLSMTSFRAESRNQNPKLSVNEQGELEVETELGLVKFTKPVAYQEKNGKRVEVECKYTIADCGMQNAECKTNLKSKIVRLSAHDEVRNPNSEIKNLQSEDPKSQIRNPKSEYGFKVASYDKTKPLIIDPLLASTYLGGSDDDYGYSLTLDTSGNVYVTGSTYSSDFPTTSGAYDTSQNGSNDVFVSKLDGGLSSLLASTYLGGSSTDYGYSLALDTSGNVYVMGTTYSTDFPTTSGAYDTSYYNGYDIFVSKLDGGLSSLLASTYLGGSRRDDGNSLTLDTSGNVYVMGLTDSTDFPTTSGAYDTSFNGNSSFYDVFISKLNGGLTSLLASTYLGGGNDDYGNALTLDTSGHVYVTGNTNSIDFPTTNGAYDTSYNGGWMDVFISKLDGGLTTLLASTYLGGSYDDEGGRSLTLDTSGNVYVMGYTVSINFPTTSGAYDTSYNGGGDDVVVSKLNGGLSSLLASTYLGGSGGDWGWSSLSLALDTSGNVYVMGLTDSTDFPTTSGAYDTSYNGDGEENDSFISKLDGELTSLLASTYLGGSDSDYCYAINLDTNGNVYVTGETDSTDFPTTSGAYDTSFNGSVDYYYRNYYDVFVSKLDSNLLSCAAAAIEASPNELTLKKKQSDEVTVTVTGEDGCPVEGDTVKAKVEGDGNQYIKVSPKKQKTDANGQAMFTIKAKDKAGNALVIFRDGSLNTQVSVKVVK